MSEIKYQTPFIFHYRPLDPYGKCFPKGGVTVVFNPETQIFGAAICSKKDVFNRKLATKIALGRSRLIKKGNGIKFLKEFADYSFLKSEKKSLTIEQVKSKARTFFESLNEKRHAVFQAKEI